LPSSGIHETTADVSSRLGVITSGKSHITVVSPEVNNPPWKNRGIGAGIAGATGHRRSI
jgi:hypothetical protein